MIRMPIRVLAYASLSVPLLLAVFVAGVVFERYRVQTWSPAPGQAATAAKAQQWSAPQARQLSRDQKIAAAMQAIEVNWRMAIDGEDLFAVRHSTNCYSARFIRRGANLRTDLKKADPNLQAGVIRISGMTATTGKFACFKSFSEALAATKSSSEDLEQVHATFSYAASDNEVRLDQAKSDPEWFARVLQYNLTDNPPSWSAVAAQRIEPD
jgi:hypothetical protein